MACVTRALVVYWSATGNTEKVAGAIVRALGQQGIPTTLKRVEEAAGEELLDYDLVFLGAPSYRFLPPPPVLKYIDQKMTLHGQRGDIKLRAPLRPGKGAVVFCTYSGPHTGIDEATPVGKCMAQLFAHLGYEVLGEWYVVGEFHGREDHSTLGRLGDIRGRPNAADLAEVEAKTRAVLQRWQRLAA